MSPQLSAVFEAIDSGELSEVDRLLAFDRALVLEREPGHFNQALHVALMGSPRPKRAAMIDLLLKHGADIHARGDDGLTPLELAAHRGVAEAVAPLVDHGADLGDHGAGTTPLLCAASGPNHAESINVLELLLARGADLHSRDRNGDDAMTLAAKAHNVHAIEFLEHRGFAIDLWGAFALKRIDQVKRLLAHGNSLPEKDLRDPVVLPEALGMIRESLEDHGAYENPLRSEAVIPDSLEIVDLLLKRGVPLTSDFAMEDAVQMPHPAILERLLSAGVDVARAHGIGLIELARQNPHCSDAMVALLEHHGARSTAPPAVPPVVLANITQKLKSPETIQRWMAVLSLQMHGPLAVHAVPDLQRVAEDDPEPFVRAAAVRALQVLSPPSQPPSPARP